MEKLWKVKMSAMKQACKNDKNEDYGDICDDYGGVSVVICLLLTSWLVCLGQLGDGVLKRCQLWLHDPEAFCKPHLLAFQKLLHLTKHPDHLVLIHARLQMKHEHCEQSFFFFLKSTGKTFQSAMTFHPENEQRNKGYLTLGNKI